MKYLATAALSLSLLFAAPSISHANDPTIDALKNPTIGELLADMESPDRETRMLAWTWFYGAVTSLYSTGTLCRHSGELPIVRHAYAEVRGMVNDPDMEAGINAQVDTLEDSNPLKGLAFRNHPARVAIPRILALKWKCTE